MDVESIVLFSVHNVITFEHLEMSAAGRSRQRCHGVLVDVVDVAAEADERGDDVGVTLDGGEQDGRLAVGGRRVRGDAECEQLLDRLTDAVDGGVVDRSSTVLVNLL